MLGASLSVGRVVSSAVVVLMILCGAVVAQGADPTSKYFDGLRRLGLFDLAEGYCFEQLGRDDLDPASRVGYTIELSRTFAEHAKYSVGDEQEDLWRRSLAVLDDFVREHSQNPRVLEVRTQAALAKATQGEYLRRQAEVFEHDDEISRRADAALALAQTRLSDVERALAAEYEWARAGRLEKDAPLTGVRLRTLLENVRYRQAVALLDRAKTKPRGNPDRAAMLIDAERRLRRLAGSLAAEELTWNSRVLLAENVRLGGETERAEKMLASLLSQNPPDAVLDGIVVQQTLVELDRGRPDEAARILGERVKARGRLPGELRYLRVKALLESWKIARAKNETSLADELLAETAAVVARAEGELGGYWGHRSRMLLEYAREADRFGPELARTIRRAAALYAEKRIDAALDAYGKAYVRAQEDGKPSAAMDLGYTRASIEAQAGRFSEAASHFGELADRFPSSKKAPTAHLLSAWSFGRKYDASPTKENRDAYERSLAAHRERFPNDPSRYEAGWMLGTLYEFEGKPVEAWKLYREVPIEHDRGPLAWAGVARCYETIIDGLRARGDDPSEWERAAIETLEKHIEAHFPNVEQPLSIPQAELALRFAKILLERIPPRYEDAELLLRRITTSWKQIAAGSSSVSSATAQAWKPVLKAANQWRIVALAGRGRVADAQALVSELSESGTLEVLAVLDGLTELTNRSDERTRRGMGEVQLQAALQLDRRRSELSPEERTRLDRCLGQAYLATNQPKRATEVYERLAKRFPKDRELLKTAASLEIQCGTRECLRQAKKNWSALEALEKPGSDAWMEARYHIAWTLHRLGDDAAARKLAGTARILYPDRGSEEIRKKLAELTAELGPG